MSAAEAGLDVYGDVTFGIPDRLRASYRTTTYFNTAPDEPLQRWLTVGADGRVRAFAGKVEYGQGVRSGFAMEVAAELRLPLEAVEVTLGDTELVPWDLIWMPRLSSPVQRYLNVRYAAAAVARG